MTGSECSPTVELAHEIGMPAEVVDRLKRLERDGLRQACLDDDTDHVLEGLTEASDRERSWRMIRRLVAPDPDGFAMLYCMLTAAARYTRRWYRQQGIGDDVFLDPMKAFTRFTCESLDRHGHYAFDRDFWTYRQLSLTLFRTGTLEYEHVDGEQVPKVLRARPMPQAVSLHIPSDADMHEAVVDDSLCRWRSFEEMFRPQWLGLPLICESWLLSPQLRHLLPSDSRILAFQRRFEIVSCDWDSPDWREWVFDANPAPVEQLPENTALRKAMKRHLLAGGKIGVGIGVLS